MGIFAKISIMEALLKLFLTVAITNIAYDKLKTYSILMLFNASVVFLIYLLYCRKKSKYTKYVFIFDKSLFKQILSFTGWNMLGSLGGTLSDSGVNLIFNTFCGVILNAAIGLANQINGALSGFIGGFQTAFKPQIVKTFAAKKMQDFHRLICRSSKISFFLFFLIAMPIICNMDYILHLWLVDVPPYACSFSQIILAGSLIDATSGVFYSAIGATGVIKNYQITITCNLTLHVIATCLLLYFGFKYEYVFFSRLLTRGLLNFITGLYFLKKLAGLQYFEYIRLALYPILKCSLLPILAIMLLTSIYGNNSIHAVLLNIFVFEFTSIIFIVRYGLSQNERNKVLSFIKNKIKK